MDKKIYTVATAHLDTVWNWDFEHVIKVCLRDTLEQNFRYFEEYPEYRFNFEGAYRYELFEEYYPEMFEQLKKYIAAGKWNVTGSSYENGDVNVPSPESLFRNILYGNLYFEKRFGKRSNDIFLPDCFGFGWALPSIAHHAGLKGFSTQKLSWGSAYGIPFDIGHWKGVDGKSIIGSFDAKSYCTTFKKIRTKKDLVQKLNINVNKYGLPITFAYHGVGDVGGAPKEPSVQTLSREMRENGASEIQVLSSSPTEFFDDVAALAEEAQVKLPTYEGELVMTDHAVGGYVSRAFGKRCNRRGEELADMAERSSVMAQALCGVPYSTSEIERSWKRIIAHTFHDDLPGTSVQRVYQRSWNDYILSLNQLTNVFEGSMSEIIGNIDTSWAQGICVVVTNTVEQPRVACVDVEIPYTDHDYVKAVDKEGKEVPSQVNKIADGKMYVSLAVYIPAMGYKAIDLLYSDEPCKMSTGLRAGKGIIENFKYIVSVNRNGDISSIIDKTLGNAEILAKPIRFEINKYDGAKEYAAWELRYKELKKMPWEWAEKGVCTLEESGPARVTLKVCQRAGKSTFTYYVSLCAGCPWVSVYNEVEWREFRRALHNGFYFNVADKAATFDLGLGAIRRGVANKKLYSVPAQRWADITDNTGAHGVSVFSDSKYSWIVKDQSSLRLTVIHTPKNSYRHDSVQSMLEFGLNRYGYAIYSHNGNLTNGTQLNARFYNQPAAVFVTGAHKGDLPDEYSFGAISNPNVIIRAIKKAENSDEIVIRVNEGANLPAENVGIFLGKGIVSARELNGMEDEIGPATVVEGSLVFNLSPYEVKTFAVRLADCKACKATAQSKVELPFNTDIVTFNHDRTSASIPTIDVSVPGELFPKTIECATVKFETGDIWGQGNNAMISGGQQIQVSGNKFYFVGASLYGDKTYTFKAGDREVPVKVQSINERIGKWDLYDLAEVADIKTDRLAWECTHTHSSLGDNVAAQLYFFMYEIDIDGADSITFPDDNGLIVLAAAQTFDAEDTKLVTPLYDRIAGRKFDYKMTGKEKRFIKKQKRKFKKPLNKS